MMKRYPVWIGFGDEHDMLIKNIVSAIMKEK